MNFVFQEERDNPAIVVALVVCIVGMLVSASGRAPRLASHINVGALFVGVSLSCLDSGLEQSGWVWILIVPVVATLFTNRDGLAWSGAVAVQIGLFTVGHAMDVLPLLDLPKEHPSATAFSATFTLAFLVVATMLYQRQRQAAEAQLMRSVAELEGEVVADGADLPLPL